MSWFSTVAVGSTYDEADETITHQIVDRPNVEKKYLSRYVNVPEMKVCLFLVLDRRIMLKLTLSPLHYESKQPVLSSQ